jgi:hypothetical protein
MIVLQVLYTYTFVYEEILLVGLGSLHAAQLKTYGTCTTV